MKRRFTVVWDAPALKRLAAMWNENPAIRGEIAEASDRIDATLKLEPESVGVPRGHSRYVVLPPLAILFRVIEEDGQVRILYVKHWYD
jgi:hypothetical protein